MPCLILRDHYLVLGVSNDATEEEIKKKYRARARELHPDLLGENATPEAIHEAEALFNEANEAYEVLRDLDKRKELDRWLLLQAAEDFGAPDDFWGGWYRKQNPPQAQPHPEPPPIPDPDRFEHEGVWIYVVYGLNYFSDCMTATVQVSINDVFKFTTDPELSHNARLTQYEVVDAKGDVVGHGYSLQGMRDSYRRFRAEENRNRDRRDWKGRLAELRAARDELEAIGQSVITLNELLRTAERKEAGAFDWSYSGNFSLAVFDQSYAAVHDARGRRYGHSRDSVTQAIREVEKEIDRLRGLDLSEVLLAELMAGKIIHPDVMANNRIITDHDLLSIRTGGEVTAYTEEVVREHYRRRLHGITSKDELLLTDLKLPDDRELIQEMINEGLIDLAPETVKIGGVKGERSYPVEYWFQAGNGQRVPVGIVTVPLVVYEKNCSKCGVKSTFPQLPHGIRLLIRIKINDGAKEVISDAYPDGPELKTEVERCLKRKTRRGVLPAEEPPPWFVGRIRRP
jgi:curved DNA-binding protein CbpA